MERRENDKLVVELTSCSKCGNPFLVKKGQKSEKLICDNCIKLGERKRKLQVGVFEKVIEVENKMNKSITDMKNQLTITKGTFNKQFFLDKIKRRGQTLLKSIELIERIEETNDEKYIDEYMQLFKKMKKESS